MGCSKFFSHDYNMLFYTENSGIISQSKKRKQSNCFRFPSDNLKPVKMLYTSLFFEVPVSELNTSQHYYLEMGQTS